MEIVLIIFAIISSVFFSAAETIYLTASKIRIEILFRRNVKKIKSVYGFIKEPESFIVTTLVGNNFANVIFSSSVVLILKDTVNEFFIILLSSLFILIFAEIIPKSVGREYSNQLIIPVACLLKIFKLLFHPINILLNSISNFFIRKFDLGEKQKVEHILSRENIQKVIRASEKDGVIKSDEGKIIERVFDMRQTRLKDPMVPRTDIMAVKKNTSIQRLLKVFTESGFSRLPVFDKNIDDIIGVVHVKDLFTKPVKLQDILQEILFVPQTKFAYKLLMEFRQKNISIAIVLDEYGGTAGLITLEDLLEELVGEIYDEFDIDNKHMYKKLNAFTFSIDAKAEVDEINEKFKLAIPEKESYSTIGGFIIEHLERIPKTGETIEFEICKIVIEKASRKRVIRVKLILKKSADK
ncbi:HlyC/CorC family transporter [candidate division KSB1 bacterium]|nr:HlyC/CorC family transporter [candidate division KSB1 bacterium]